jgi:hypothetical protein
MDQRQHGLVLMWCGAISALGGGLVTFDYLVSGGIPLWKTVSQVLVIACGVWFIVFGYRMRRKSSVDD